LKPAQVFDCLPIAALVAKDIFCVHGGLSPQLSRPENVNSIKRPCKILAERNDLLSDLTWSDPHQKIKGAPADSGLDVLSDADPPR
jgi:serine/threonine-protein phosphatase PP1 catalytic subunit